MGVMREIEILISPEGEVQIQVKGVKGKSCLDFSKFLEEGLGDIESREYTSEYYEPEVQISKYITESSSDR